MLRSVALGLGLAFVGAVSAFAQGEVYVYSTREPGLVQPLLDAFTAETGIRVNALHGAQGLAERVAAEGVNSPADVLMTVDYGSLIDLVDRGLTQAIQSDVLNTAIPENLRDPGGHWYALSIRARVIYVSADRVPDEFMTYEDLADPRWAGRVCIRSGQHPYNTSLFAAYLAKHGPGETEAYLRSLKGNLARPAAGGDRDGARDIFAGICDVAIGNSYYVGLMRSGAGGQLQRDWGEAIRVILPTFEDRLGTHVNVSGAAVAAHAPNLANAIRLMEFLVSDEAQRLYAETNFEYPVMAETPAHSIITELGTLTIDPLPLTEIADLRDQASRLVDEVGFDY